MIYINRTQYRAPKVLSSSAAVQARKACNSFFVRKRRTRTQRRFNFQWNIYKHSEVKEALHKLFHGKCAYCESSPVTSLDVDHFRPKTGALGVKGAADPDHYYWLAYEWDNLYPVCIDCDRNKRSYFPVVGKRAVAGATGDELAKEQPLLIDPCLDRPELYLYFKNNGVVYPRRRLDATKSDMVAKLGISRRHRVRKAKTSIDIYNLNRPILVEARRRAAEWISMILVRPKPNKEEFDSFKKRLEKALDINQPYIGMIRQLVEEWMVTTIGTRNVPRRTKEFLLQLASELDIILPFKDIKKTKKWAKAAKPVRMAAQYEEEMPQELPSLRTDYIKSIEICNFKAISKMKLEFSSLLQAGASWKVLLGENGVGKSSVLQAASLALMGQERLKELSKRVNFNPSRILRYRTKKGWVKIRLTDRKDPVLLTITDQGLHYESGEEGVNTFLNAYGTSRLVPLTSLPKKARLDEAIMCENLFNPFAPLLDVNKYLYSLKRGMEFDRTAMALKDLMSLATDSNVLRKEKKVWVQVGNSYYLLDELGDGYQSVAVIATDIFKNYPEGLADLQQAIGIVLVDEIGTYLHPRWRMRIVKSLRTAFPGIQFLATTHDPLCLRGLEDKEIALMERDEETGKVTVNDNLPSTKGMRVDQLLMSELFGLHSTFDPEAEHDMAEYYKLLAKPRLTAAETKRRNALKGKVASYDLKLGLTPREQFLYEAIDAFLAKEQKMQSEKRTEEREEVKKKVIDLWKEYEEAKLQ